MFCKSCHIPKACTYHNNIDFSSFNLKDDDNLVDYRMHLYYIMYQFLPYKNQHLTNNIDSSTCLVNISIVDA